MKAFLTGITKATIIRFSVMELTRERIYVASYQTPFYKMDGYIMLHLDDISIYVLSYFYNFTPDNYMKTSGASAKSENENIPLLNDIMEGCETALQYQKYTSIDEHLEPNAFITPRSNSYDATTYTILHSMNNRINDLQDNISYFLSYQFNIIFII
ncbi:unnamed protein product [Lactuca saligna]|uniref:Uncharacterized protein n=1 Tax=Lactuca saligna TaxID=75948 RepID=A0AA35YRS6_LACSI|nr:unnamed protein product [Lactuca saligna]